MQNLKTDVAVIGAGPAGSSVAKFVAHQGFSSILIEKDAHPGATNVCAGGMPKLVFEDTEVSSEVIEKKIPEERHYFPWGENIINSDLVTVYRNVFDRCLADKAVENGAKLLTGTQIKDVYIRNNRVHLFSANTSVESKIVVFADGPNTLAYKKFGIGFKSNIDTTMVSVSCDVKWENNPMNQCEFYYGEKIAPWGYGWIFPRKDTVNIGIACLYGKLHSNLIDSLDYFLKKYPLTNKLFKEKEILKISSALIPVAPANRIFGEHVLVVGDAAGMVDPITAEGIAPSISGGKLAGKMCCASLEMEDFSTKFLSEYQRLWHKSNYSYLYRKFLISNVFLLINRFDKNAYSKLAVITGNGIGKALRRNIFNPPIGTKNINQ